MKKNRISSLYIHIPFCESICDYCDFTKLQYFHNFATNYIAKLKEEIKSKNINYKLKTLFIGGGTPTSLEDSLFLDLLSFLSTYVDNNTEYTIECNPESLSVSKLKIMHQYGVNRISIGVESTDDKILKSINRKHTFLDVKNAINNAINIGITNINVDLILGLPNVTYTRLKKDIENIISLPIKHVSCYGLTVHEHTVFYINKITPPSDDVIRKMYDLVNEILTNNGYIHYEVSNWCKPNFMCKHNLVYWKDEEYFGCGLGASGYEDNTRYTNTRNLSKYLLDYNTKEMVESISLNDDKTYFLMTNLRTILGIDLKRYFDKFNEDFYLTNKVYLDSLIDKKILIFDKENNKIYCSYEGLMTLNQILLNLI